MTVSQLGDRVTELALPLIAAITLHASAAAVSFQAAVTWLPNLAGVFLGAWVDRRRRKRHLMIAADLARAAVLLSLPIAAAFHAVTLGQLYAVALLCGARQCSSTPRIRLLRAPGPALGVRLRQQQARRQPLRLVHGRSGGGRRPDRRDLRAVRRPADSLSFLFSALTLARVRVAEPEPEAAEFRWRGGPRKASPT